MFSLTPSAIPTGGVGVLIGAVMVYLVKSKPKRVAMINWVVTVIAVFPAVGAFVVSCVNLPIPGIDTPYAIRCVGIALGLTCSYELLELVY